jgi:hypothetical protein
MPTITLDGEELEYTVTTEVTRTFPEEVIGEVIRLKCPGCGWGVSNLTPKCPWEQGGYCGRHDALMYAKDNERRIKLELVQGIGGDAI